MRHSPYNTAHCLWGCLSKADQRSIQYVKSKSPTKDLNQLHDIIQNSVRERGGDASIRISAVTTPYGKCEMEENLFQDRPTEIGRYFSSRLLRITVCEYDYISFWFR
jgi:hypothetical protein